MPVHEPLACTLSRIHRSQSVEQLWRVLLRDVPRLIEADAFGLYLFDRHLNPETILSHGAKPRFLAEYEDYRNGDPLLRELMARKKFTHSLELYSQQEWLQLPLHRFLSRWGLAFSIQAPLLADDTVVGTINFATGNRRYFSPNTLNLARFMCGEIEVAYGRLTEVARLHRELRRRLPADGPLDDMPARTRQVAELAAAGLRNKAIARRLRISENTVRYHIKRVYRETGVRNRAQLANCLNGAVGH